MTPDPQTATAGLASPANRKTHLLARILRPHWKTLLVALDRRHRRNGCRHPRTVAHHHRRRQRSAGKAARGRARRCRAVDLRPEHLGAADLRADRRAGDRHRGRHQQLRRKISHDERQPVGRARPQDAPLPAHSAPVAGRARQVAIRRSGHARHQGYRRGAGLHRHGPARHHRRRPDARGHDRGHVVDELALHPRRAVGGAGVVSRRVFLLTPDQGRVANRQEEGK